MMDDPIERGNIRLCPWCGKLLPRENHVATEQGSRAETRPVYDAYGFRSYATTYTRHGKLSGAMRRHIETCPKRSNDAERALMGDEMAIAIEILFLANLPPVLASWTEELHDEYGRLLPEFQHQCDFRTSPKDGSDARRCGPCGRVIKYWSAFDYASTGTITPPVIILPANIDDGDFDE